MRCTIVYSFVVGVALFGGGGSDASQAPAPRVQTVAVRSAAPGPTFERAATEPGLQSP